jgi:uncharacterized protein YrrD
MRVELDAKVRTRDGQAAGSVQRAIIDPQANEVSEFVVSTGGLFGHDVLVPRERLESASREGDSIRLDLTKEELKDLPEFAPARYTAPEPGWIPPSGYGYPLGSMLWPVGYVYAEESVAGRARVEAETEGDAEANVWPTIDKGTIVRDRAGEQIGVVDDVRFDASSGRLEGLDVRAGGAIETFFGGGDILAIARSQIERVDEGVVYLRAHKDDLTRNAG